MNDELILNRYRLLERLATGGTAEVWRAHDEQLGRPVAVKRLHAHLLPDEASRKRLVAEARAAAGLSHPVIVGVYDVDATGDSPALVMELVEGESLAARIDREGPLPPRQAVAVAADVAEALYHAHQRGVIHRDVKPGNVLLATDGRTRLVDFGIAHSLAAAVERLTLTGTVIGTLSAMAPEQLHAGAITPRTDLYGLGAVLYQALTGRAPYQAASPVALADAQRAGPPPLGDLEPALAAVIGACLAYEPAHRPLHAGALAAALRDWLAGDPGPALAMAPPAPVDTAAITQPIPVVAPVAAATGAAGAPAQTSARPTHAASRLMPLALVAALAVLLVLGAVAIAGLDGQEALVAGETPTPTPTATPSATPSPTPVPEWMAKLAEEIEKECGPDVLADVTTDLALMQEEQAKDYAEELIRQCKDADDGGGRGNGNGNGNGRGGGDD